MDQVSQFFAWFSYPIFLQKVTPKTKIYQRVKFFWCAVSAIWFIYHYGHIWFVPNFRSIYDFATYTHISIPLGHILNLINDFFWPLAVKLYLMSAYFSEPSLLRIIRQLNEVHSELFDDKSLLRSDRSFTVKVWIILLGHFLVIFAFTILLIKFLSDCFKHVASCEILYLTPWLDPFGEAINSMTYSVGTSILPITVSVACLQFAICLNQVTKAMKSGSYEESGHVTRDAKLVVSLTQIQSELVKAISGWLFILVSLLSLKCVTVVSQLALRIIKAKGHAMIKVAAEFGYIVLLCYSSSRAVEAKQDLLDEMVQQRIKMLANRPPPSIPTIRPSYLTVQSLNYLIETIDKTSVEVTAAGYYSLNKSLILSLIGTSFTYTLILIRDP